MATKSSINICQLKISPPLLLAPMVGVTHSALRVILYDYGGVGLFSTEMLSARRLPSENKNISPYLLTTEKERPLSYQLFVTAEKEVGRAFEKLHELGADAIDLNLGCPAPTIRQAGGGGVLMKDSRAVRGIVRAARKLTALPLTAKIRLGHQLDRTYLKNFCRMLEDEGINLEGVKAILAMRRGERK